MDIYVGNLPFRLDESELREAFEEFGKVSRAKIVKDRETNRSKGFGFVEMEDSDALKAIKALDGKELFGRSLRVNEAKPKS
ncbi:MAG: RNA-binding protein [Campylobacteraceae bacterium]|nr:RNA-binding protein [Campylobacteraceae bacterium]